MTFSKTKSLENDLSHNPCYKMASIKIVSKNVKVQYNFHKAYLTKYLNALLLPASHTHRCMRTFLTAIIYIGHILTFLDSKFIFQTLIEDE